MTVAAYLRRARPMLGTLVEVGVRGSSEDLHDLSEVAFARILEVQQSLSRFDAGSDIACFNASDMGEQIHVRRDTARVLAAACELHAASDGAFDVSLGTARDGWRLDGDMLHKRDAAVSLDLGGIGKGYAVDAAVSALLERGCCAGWVNAGGDLRTFGDVDVPVHVRDERTGGVRPFASIRDGAFATSNFRAGARSRLTPLTSRNETQDHISVAAPECMWADALTKLVALQAVARADLLARYGATAWTHT